MMNSFWWGFKPDGGGRIHWASWKKLCSRKDEGEVGFRDLHGFNLAMLAKQGWNIISKPDSLVCRILKAKYLFPRGDFFSSSLGFNPSFTWKSIWSAKSVLFKGCRWRVGDGGSINVWSDPWLKTASFRVSTSVVSGLENLKVTELMVSGRREWNVEFVKGLFLDCDVEAILSLPLSKNAADDKIIWQFDKRGYYSVKSGYRCAMEDSPRGELVGFADVWKRLW